VSSPVSPSDPNFLQLQWQYGLFGTSIGQAGLLVSDLDGDGTPEIIASASGGGFESNTFWYIARHAAGGSYEQIWRSENYSVTLARIVIADLTGDGKDDIIVGLSDGTVQIFDGPTRETINSYSVAAPLIDLAVADLNQDGTKEIVTSNGTGVFEYAAGSGALLWSNPSGGGYSIAVGNVDADAALEIVTTTSGGAGYVIDGVSHVIEWGYVNSFGARVGLGDLDGDGMQEIVGAAAWYKITIFDADLRSPSWEIATDLDIGSLVVADAEADGVPEILYGDGQWGEVHAVNAQTRTDKWSVNNPEHGVSGIALGDVDKDGKKEVLWGAGGTSTGPDYLYVADPGSGTIEWQNKHLDAWLSPLSVGDVDDDGQDEIVMVSYSSDSGYAEGIISIFDAKTHALEYQDKLGIMDWMGVRSVRIGDVDNDGKTEFVVTTGDIYDGVIQVYDGASHTKKIQSIGYDGNFFSALAIGDVDGDGKTEIVAGQGREHTGAPGVYLIVFDGTWLTEKWRSVDLGTYWGSVYDIKLADLDGDGHTEIVASVYGSRLIVYDGVTHVQKLLLDHPACALEIKDSDGDNALEILVGRDDGKIDVFNGSTYALEKTVVTFDSFPINALRLADLDGNGALDWLVTRGNTLVVLEGQDPGLKWRSADLSANAGLFNHLGVKDIDGDGKLDVFLGANLAIYQFD
jgi:WD40 repeat protein